MGEGKEEPEGFRKKKKGKGRGGEQDATRQATGLRARSCRSHGNVSLRPCDSSSASQSRPPPRSAPLCSAPPPGCVRPAPLCRAERWHDACAREKKKKESPARRLYKRGSGLFLVSAAGSVAGGRSCGRFRAARGSACARVCVWVCVCEPRTRGRPSCHVTGGMEEVSGWGGTP